MVLTELSVVTSVDRDDLEDFKGETFCCTLLKRFMKTLLKKQRDFEVLIPDFNAVEKHMHALADSDLQLPKILKQ